MKKIEFQLILMALMVLLVPTVIATESGVLFTGTATQAKDVVMQIWNGSEFTNNYTLVDAVTTDNTRNQFVWENPKDENLKIYAVQQGFYSFVEFFKYDKSTNNLTKIFDAQPEIASSTNQNWDVQFDCAFEDVSGNAICGVAIRASSGSDLAIYNISPDLTTYSNILNITNGQTVEGLDLISRDNTNEIFIVRNGPVSEDNITIYKWNGTGIESSVSFQDDGFSNPKRVWLTQGNNDDLVVTYTCQGILRDGACFRTLGYNMSLSPRIAIAEPSTGGSVTVPSSHVRAFQAKAGLPGTVHGAMVTNSNWWAFFFNGTNTTINNIDIISISSFGTFEGDMEVEGISKNAIYLGGDSNPPTPNYAIQYANGSFSSQTSGLSECDQNIELSSSKISNEMAVVCQDIYDEFYYAFWNGTSWGVLNFLKFGNSWNAYGNAGIFSFDITVIIIDIISPISNQSINYNQSINLTINITSTNPIDIVTANITLPNSSTILLNLNNITANTWQAQFNQTDSVEQYYVTFWANDTEGGDSSTSSSFFINNTPPSISGLNITPSPAYTDSLLHCVDTSTDLEGQNIIKTYVWFVTEFLLGTTSQISGQFLSSLDCDAVSGCDRGDTITCELTATDTFGDSEVQNYSRLISNRAPSASPVIDTVPSGGNINQSNDLNCTVILYDSDGDSVSINNFNWTIDGVDVGIDGQFLGSGNLSAASNVSCSVTITDGFSNVTESSGVANLADSTSPSFGNFSVSPTSDDVSFSATFKIEVSDTQSGINQVYINITRDGQNVVTNQLMSLESGNWTYNKNIINQGNYSVAFRARDAAGNTATTNYSDVLEAFNQDPIINSLTASQTSGTVTYSTTLTVTATDSNEDIQSVLINISRDGTQVVTDQALTKQSATTWTYSYSVSTAGDYTVKAIALDRDNNFDTITETNLFIGSAGVGGGGGGGGETPPVVEIPITTGPVFGDGICGEGEDFINSPDCEFNLGKLFDPDFLLRRQGSVIATLFILAILAVIVIGIGRKKNKQVRNTFGFS